MRAALRSLACVVAAGCATASLPSLVGTPTSVEILDAGFVRFEGERIPREAFLYEMRRRVREAREDRERRPSVRVFMDASGDAPADPYALDSLLLELERSGVKSVTLG